MFFFRNKVFLERIIFFFDGILYRMTEKTLKASKIAYDETNNRKGFQQWKK